MNKKVDEEFKFTPVEIVDMLNKELVRQYNNYKAILTELEEWLEMMEEKETIGTYSMVQDKIQELKEKYK